MRYCLKAMLLRIVAGLGCAALLVGTVYAQVLTSSDLSRLRSVGSVALSPDGRYIAYAIMMRDLPGRPYDQLWVMELNTGKSVRLGGDKAAGAPTVVGRQQVDRVSRPGRRQAWSLDCASRRQQHRLSGARGGHQFSSARYREGVCLVAGWKADRLRLFQSRRGRCAGEW